MIVKKHVGPYSFKMVKCPYPSANIIDLIYRTYLHIELRAYLFF